MIGVVEGDVVGLERSGFRLLNTWGTEVRVSTMGDGRRLGLRVGDRVRVYGGPDPDGVFCCSGIYAREAGGGEREIVDPPRVAFGFGWIRQLGLR